MNTTFINQNLCSTPRSNNIRYSLSKYVPKPVDSSTPNRKKMQKSFVPDIYRLIYSSNNTKSHGIKIWVL